MKRALTLALLSLCMAVSAAAQKATDWIKFTSAEGRYTVSLPSSPKVSQQESADADGNKFPQYLASSVDGNGVYLVAYFDYKAQMTFSMDKARDKMADAVKGTVISDETVSFAGSPARKLKMSYRDNDVTYLIRALFYDAGGRIYVLESIFPKDEDGPVLEGRNVKFFDSFTTQATP